MGIPAERQAVFFALTQERSKSLMEMGDNSPAILVNESNEAIGKHPGFEKVVMTR
jgi:hypothetical protein